MTEKSYYSNDPDLETVRENYLRITENIEKAKLAANRTDAVRLMAVTKTVTPEKINYAVSLGAFLLGENRVQEFLGKREFYDKKSEIHFIGGLQNNKVKYIIDKVSMIHSVNSLKLAEEIDKRALSAGKVMDVLLEINIAAEESKSGILPEELPELLARCREMKNLRPRGLMAIPPLDVNGSNERYFSAMQRLFEDNRTEGFDALSMGMSHDYEDAIKYGSTIVRIGSSLFGYRK